MSGQTPGGAFPPGPGGAFPPGPRLPAAIQAALVLRDPYGWMERRWRRYGDCFSSRFPGFGRVVYVASPEGVRTLFTGDPKLLHAGEANAGPLEPVLGPHSLLTLDEERHLSQRKLLLPPFHGDRVRRYAQLMEEITAREVEGWPVGRPFPLRPRMQELTLRVILQAVFGVREQARLERLRRAIVRLAAASGLIVLLVPLRRDLGRHSPWARFLRARAAVDELVYEEIRSRRASGGEGEDVLSLLLAARHEDGSPMSDVELRDELLTLLTAGHETTATALSWAFERLLREPAVLGRLLDRLDDDPYLDAVVKETLRIRPVITDVARKVTRDTEVMGYAVPAGTLVLAAIAVLHRRVPEPDAFRPERWLDDGADPYTWIPFGGGVRRCLGAAFAQLELRVVLRAVLERARLAAVDSRPEPPRVRHVTVVPGRGSRVVLERRLAPRPADRGAAMAAPAG